MNFAAQFTKYCKFCLNLEKLSQLIKKLSQTFLNCIGLKEKQLQKYLNCDNFSTREQNSRDLGIKSAKKKLKNKICDIIKFQGKIAIKSICLNVFKKLFEQKSIK